MMRRYYKKTPRSLTTLEFLILNPDCPRSIMNSLNQVSRHITDLSHSKHPDKNSAEFLVGKIRAEYEFKSIEEIEEDVQGFIEKILKTLNDIAKKIEIEYFL